MRSGEEKHGSFFFVQSESCNSLNVFFLLFILHFLQHVVIFWEEKGGGSVCVFSECVFLSMFECLCFCFVLLLPFRSNVFFVEELVFLFERIFKY